jgi:hypothetical protein
VGGVKVMFTYEELVMMPRIIGCAIGYNHIMLKEDSWMFSAEDIEEINQENERYNQLGDKIIKLIEEYKS